MSEAKLTVVRWWFWRCPECGIDHRQAGYLLPESDLECELCVADDGKRVRLRCWPAEE